MFGLTLKGLSEILNADVNLLNIPLKGVTFAFKSGAARLGEMATLVLSVEERQAISDILDQAEREFLTPIEPYMKIKKIDRQIKSVWPDWEHSSLSPPPQVSSLGSKVTPPVNSPDSRRTSNRSPEVLLEEVGALKEEVQNLMVKIGESVKSPRFSPKAKRIASRIQESSWPKPTQDPPIQYDRVNNNQAVLNEQTASERRASLIDTEKQMKMLERDNRQLRRRLKELNNEFQESQKEIEILKKALKRSEALQMRISDRLRSEVSKKKANPWK